MTDELIPPPPPQPPLDRPWQFSLLDLFGLTTAVSVCAAAFYWNPLIGTAVSVVMYLSIATFYRTKAVVRFAAPSLRERSLSSLVGFGVATSFVACFASLCAFFLTFIGVGMGAIVVPSPRLIVPILVFACFLGGIAGLIVLYRSWPRRPKSR